MSDAYSFDDDFSPYGSAAGTPAPIPPRPPPRRKPTQHRPALQPIRFRKRRPPRHSSRLPRNTSASGAANTLAKGAQSFAQLQQAMQPKPIQNTMQLTPPPPKVQKPSTAGLPDTPADPDSRGPEHLDGQPPAVCVGLAPLA
jgi:hypothetical protein